MSQITAENISPTPVHKNIFKRLYYGELPLDVTFWVFFCTTVVFLRIILPLKVDTLILTYGAEALLYLVIPHYIFLFTFTLVILIGQWRAATKYTGKKMWAVLVKIITIVAALDCVLRIPDVWHMAVALKYG